LYRTTLDPEPHHGEIRPVGCFEKLKCPFRPRRPFFRGVRDDDWLADAQKVFPRNVSGRYLAFAFNLDALHIDLVTIPVSLSHFDVTNLRGHYHHAGLPESRRRSRWQR